MNELVFAAAERTYCQQELLDAIRAQYKLIALFVKREDARDAEIADNMRDFWKSQSCGAE